MARKRVSLILLAAFVASSTGLLLAVHLHQTHEGHDSHHCDLCISLVWAPPACLDNPRIALDQLAVSGSAPIVNESAVFISHAHPAFASRAPPLT